MACRAGGDRFRKNAGGTHTRRVVFGGEVSGEHAEPRLAVERPRGRFENRGLAGARRSHQVHRDDVVIAEVLAVVAGDAIVARENALMNIERHDFRVSAPA